MKKADILTQLEQLLIKPIFDETTQEIDNTKSFKIRELIQKYVPQKISYTELIELLSKYIKYIYSKNDSRPADQFTHLINEENEKFACEIFKYICNIIEHLSEKHKITLSYDTLKRLFSLNTNEMPKDKFNCKRLAELLIKNEENLNSLYKILIETSQLEIFANLISSEEFKKNHEIVDEFLTNCTVNEFIDTVEIIEKSLDKNFDILSIAKKHKQKEFLEELICILLIKKENKRLELIHEILSDPDIHINYDFLYYSEGTLKSIIATYSYTICQYPLIPQNPNKAQIIEDMLNNPKAISPCYAIQGFNGTSIIFLYELYAAIGNYEESLTKFKLLNNQQKPQFNLINQEGAIKLKYFPYEIPALKAYISHVCTCLIWQKIDFDKRKEIILSILNDENSKYIEINVDNPNLPQRERILFMLQLALNENDFKEILDLLFQKQNEGTITFVKTTTTKDKSGNINDCTITKLNGTEINKLYIEYSGHQKSIGTNPTKQDD